jgi:plasmid stabilization system protein ParE
MARVELAPGVLDDFDRFLHHMVGFEVTDPNARIAEVIEVIDVLRHSPLIGWRVKGAKRELVIGRDGRGYVVLYRFVASADTVFILAIRSQQEARYKRRR